jgi:hypothetical protein
MCVSVCFFCNFAYTIGLYVYLYLSQAQTTSTNSEPITPHNAGYVEVEKEYEEVEK